MKNSLVWNSATKDFALVSPELATAMLTVGNTEGFNRAIHSPWKPLRITIRQVRSGECAVDLLFNNDASLTHKSGRWESRKLADQLHAETGALVYNVKVGGQMAVVHAAR